MLEFYEYRESSGFGFLGTFIFWGAVIVAVAWLTEGHVWCTDSDTACLQKRVEEAHQREREEAACSVPQLVSKAPDGVSLWVINADRECPRRAVYFSSGGAHTTHEECHQSGKVRNCEVIDDDVPNGRAGQ